jgi:hypothetical protein
MVILRQSIADSSQRIEYHRAHAQVKYATSVGAHNLGAHCRDWDSAGGRWMGTIPDVSALARTNPPTTALIQTWKHAHARRMNPEWIWMPLSKISPHLQRAVIMAEDASFFQHEGFDWEGIKYAAAKDLEAGTFKKGGSTITQKIYISPPIRHSYEKPKRH